MALLKTHTHIVVPGIFGCASVYILWAMWGLLFGWGERMNRLSYTYTVGDHLILPLFSSIAFILLWTDRRNISRRTIVSSIVIIPLIVAILMAFFDPDTSRLRETGSLTSSRVPDALLWIHMVFIFSQLCLIVFIGAVYPFLDNVWKPLAPITVLYLLLEGFALLLFMLDNVHFPPLIEILSMAIPASAWIVFIADSRLRIIKQIKN